VEPCYRSFDDVEIHSPSVSSDRKVPVRRGGTKKCRGGDCPRCPPSAWRSARAPSRALLPAGVAGSFVDVKRADMSYIGTAAVRHEMAHGGFFRRPLAGPIEEAAS
jgi:hypothetical protein